ncbi:hypothetical protein [Kitasatospora sp. NBC_01539]|uniref:hypothetical protein n=1 Tax=Kitasatospora sp. NBC_01539 TaxID=2903577 RepID=UPI0038601F9E
MITPVSQHADLLAQGLREAAAARIAALRTVLCAPPPPREADRHRWELLLDEEQRSALAETSDLVRLRDEAGRAWVEDRWGDLVHLAHRHRRQLPLGHTLMESVRRIEDATGDRRSDRFEPAS